MTNQTCIFQGTAGALHLRGQGAAILLNQSLYEQGHAKRVILVGAQIGTTGKHNLDFSEPQRLDPIGEHPAGAPYQISYKADGELLTAHVLMGGGNGTFQGKLNGFPECESKVCELVWAGPSRTIKVERKDPNTSMMVGEGFITGKEIGPASITVEDVKGKLKCPDGERDIQDTRQIWTGGEQSGLAINKLSIGPQGLELEIESVAGPDRAIAMPLGSKLALGIGPLIGALLILWFVMRKKPEAKEAEGVRAASA